jgi:hypothetical protein
MTATENSASRVRTWQEEADMLLSLLDCVVPEHEAVFASSEFFTGKRFYDLCLENEARTPEEVEKKLGPEYKISVLTKNKEQGRSFARKLRELGHKIVLTPVVFNVSDLNDGRNWSGSEYMGFWNLMITKKCDTVYLNEFWQFSDSCVFHYIAGLKTEKKLLDHAGNFVVLESAKKMVLSAVRRLEDFGFDVPNLHEALTEPKRFSSIG